MNGKRWVIFFAVAIICFMGVFMATNYVLDSTGYFAEEHNKDKYGAVSYFKASKIKHIKKNSKRYTGFVIGGSKSGTMNTKRLEMYTGDKWYNLCVNSSTFHEYYLYINWLSNNTDVKKVCLYLSGHEVNRTWLNEKEKISTSNAPQLIKGNELQVFCENLNYLTLDVESNIDYMKANDEYEEKYYYDSDKGSIVYLEYNALRNENEREKYMQSNVLESYQKDLQTLFAKGNKNLVSISENISELERIKCLCQNKNLDLTVILGPTFLGELARYESQGFYSYLRCLVNQVPIWNFSGINDINMNPYNFVNTTHCNEAVNNLVIDVVFGGKGYETKEVLLTNSNINEYLIDRKEKIEELKEEYERTGTVQLNESYEERVY